MGSGSRCAEPFKTPGSPPLATTTLTKIEDRTMIKIQSEETHP